MSENRKGSKNYKTKMKNRKRKEVENKPQEEDVTTIVPARYSDEPVSKKAKWVNRQRVLVFGTRGISHQHRHLMKDLEKLMPHSRHGNKMERKENLFEVNEMCALRNCNKCVLFDGRLRRDLYMWMSNISDGPSAKFLVESIYTSGELKLTGNCLTGSRPLLSFDENFSKYPHFDLLKELFTQVFGVPNNHPKSQPFVDHVISFSILDNKIWYRNYQIISEDGALAEIGPRFVLNPIKIFDGSFNGATLWENQHYVTPARSRRLLLEVKTNKSVNRKEQKKSNKINQIEKPPDVDEEMYRGNTLEVARKLAKKELGLEQKTKRKHKKRKSTT